MIAQSIDLANAVEVIHNPDVESLIRDCLTVDACKLADSGAVVAYSGKFTGRTPRDKYIVREPGSEADIWWENNNAMDANTFKRVRESIQSYIESRRLYVIDCYAGANPRYRIAVRFIVERPYHALFVKQLLIRPTERELLTFEPEWTIINAGKLKLDAKQLGIRSESVIALNFAEKQVLIAGTEYAGEMKKGVFTIMNYLLPLQGVLGMHCSSNIGADGKTVLFFGLSGTGKTTLSADPERRLIGDDEHGWSDDGVFNIEGGCYAKCIKLSKSGEPQIWNAIRRGSVLENVVLDASGVPDYNDESITENTRCAYPVEFIDGAVIPSVGGSPDHIIFLTCDALSVFPPISRLTPDQAMFYFLNGYTAKVAGTEAGVTEPTVTFSTCFGQPFLPLKPKAYAELLKRRIERHSATVWLVNTGWTGGPVGIGKRISLSHTRRLVHDALSGELDLAEFQTEPAFGLQVPKACEGVPSDILLPRQTWKDAAAYDAQAAKLAALFDINYKGYV